MSIDHYNPHVLVLPEDDANRQIANGFLLDPNLNGRVIQILPVAGGWRKVIEKFNKNHASKMSKFPERRVVLLIDSDRVKDRLSDVKRGIPDALKDRVFVLGVLSEPERMKRKISGINSFEDIGEALAKDCYDNTCEIWGHALLKHNESEVNRMSSFVKPYLFR